MYVAAIATITAGTNHRLRDAQPDINRLPAKQCPCAPRSRDHQELSLRPPKAAPPNSLQTRFLLVCIRHLITVVGGDMRQGTAAPSFPL
jgi:hypothetical protein